MPWWVTNVLFPLSPAIIAVIVGLAYVPPLRAAYNAIGQGQLFFVAAALAGQSLSSVPKNDSNSLTVGSLWAILIISVALFTAATIWKDTQPPRRRVADFLVIAGSLGMVVWAINIAVGTPSAP